MIRESALAFCRFNAESAGKQGGTLLRESKLPLAGEGEPSEFLRDTRSKNTYRDSRVSEIEMDSTSVSP